MKIFALAASTAVLFASVADACRWQNSQNFVIGSTLTECSAHETVIEQWFDGRELTAIFTSAAYPVVDRIANATGAAVITFEDPTTRNAALNAAIDSAPCEPLYSRFAIFTEPENIQNLIENFWNYVGRGFDKALVSSELNYIYEIAALPGYTARLDEHPPAEGAVTC